MGDRYFLTLDCPYCGSRNNDVYYAPTCNFLSHICEHCGKKFFIDSEFAAVKEEGWTVDMDKQAFKMATNAFTDEEVDEMYKEK